MNMIKSDECPVMRLLRKSGELRRYYLEKENQAILENTSFKDALQAQIESGQKNSLPHTPIPAVLQE